MVGYLSMGFPEVNMAILKSGMDEVVFKIYATNHSLWEIYGAKQI